MVTTAEPPLTELPAGLYFQLFLDAMNSFGNVAKQVQSAAASLSSLAPLARGVMLHDSPKAKELNGLPKDPVVRAVELVHLANFGWPTSLTGLSYGLDGSRDGDDTALTVEEKGERMGRAVVAARARYCGHDLEGQFDSTKNASDDMNEAGAIRLETSYRLIAPTTFTFDQSWPAIDQHGENRKKVLPIGQGGSFAGFPADELAKFLNLRTTQFYWANWYSSHGASAYKFLLDWQERDWAAFEKNLAKLDPKLVLPRTVSIQGYAHEAYPWLLVRATMEYATRPIIMWCSPTPTADTLRTLDMSVQLTDRALSARTTVQDVLKANQRAWKITADGLMGPASWAAYVKAGRKVIAP